MTPIKQLTDRFWHAFEAGQIDDLRSFIDADCHFKMPGMELRGADALIEMLRAYRDAFPDLGHEVLQFVESGETIAIELVVRGTHTGTMRTRHGEVPATGRQVIWESCDYIRARHGKIASWHVYHDSVPFLTALGLLPSSTQA